MLAGDAPFVKRTYYQFPGSLASMEIRTVRPEEYAEAGRVTALAYQEFVPPDPEPGWSDYLAMLADVDGRAGRTLVLVAVEDGRVVGTATVELERTIGDEGELQPGQANLRMLGVDPAARGKGVGRALVEASLESARTAGKKVMTLRTTTLMKVAQRMYEAMGFERDPGRDEAFPEVSLLAYRMDL